jgi:hypothetical protein
VNAKGTIQKKDGKQVVELVPVRLEVKLVDVWAVSEFIQGKQHDLFQDSETLASRMVSVTRFGASDRTTFAQRS